VLDINATYLPQTVAFICKPQVHPISPDKIASFANRSHSFVESDHLKSTMGIFNRKEALADTPKEVLNWRLYWSTFVFGKC
jgi:hypothetical protein